MSDPESPDPTHRPLKPILPPISGIPEQEAKDLREYLKTIPRSLEPELPEMISPERQAKYALDLRDFSDFPRVPRFRWYGAAELVLENLGSLVKLSLLTASSLVVVYFTDPSGKWGWILGTLAIVVVGYTVMRGIERVLLRRFARRKPDPPKARYHMLTNQSKRVTFKNVALPEQVLDNLTRVIEFLKEPQKYQKLGAPSERGVLLVGPPGIGKTLAGFALAGEANVPFFWLSEPPSNISELHAFFDSGLKNAPAILFIDNIDAIARSRSIWPDPATLNLESMTTVLTALLDAMEPHDGVIVIAATNRPDLIDEALIRPGRLNVIEISYPTLREIEGIFKIHTRKVPLSEDVDISVLARRLLELCPQCTGAIVAETCNRAANLSAQKSAKLVSQESFLIAMEQLCKAPGKESHE